jgi:hypothetical protein
MTSTDRGANPLAPIMERAELAAMTERPQTPAVQVAIAEGRLLFTGDDANSGDRGRWIASDTHVDCEYESR